MRYVYETRSSNYRAFVDGVRSPVFKTIAAAYEWLREYERTGR